jgi:hypothetical protein
MVNISDIKKYCGAETASTTITILILVFRIVPTLLVKAGKMKIIVLRQRGKKNNGQDCDVDGLDRRCDYIRRNHAPAYGYVREERKEE